jgi:hypothetical protein
MSSPWLNHLLSSPMIPHPDVVFVTGKAAEVQVVAILCCSHFATPATPKSHLSYQHRPFNFCNNLQTFSLSIWIIRLFDAYFTRLEAPAYPFYTINPSTHTSVHRLYSQRNSVMVKLCLLLGAEIF